MDNLNHSITINIGVLGHVDSGKTALVRALTSIQSTASLDKHPQSKERGITIDLGFSAFFLPIFSSKQNDYTFLLKNSDQDESGLKKKITSFIDNDSNSNKNISNSLSDDKFMFVKDFNNFSLNEKRSIDNSHNHNDKNINYENVNHIEIIDNNCTNEDKTVNCKRTININNNYKKENQNSIIIGSALYNNIEIEKDNKNSHTIENRLVNTNSYSIDNISDSRSSHIHKEKLDNQNSNNIENILDNQNSNNTENILDNQNSNNIENILDNQNAQYNDTVKSPIYWKICLVDCPGHASLIKTVLNGSQIIDLVFLVIDINKGFQSQTSECLVIAEIMTSQIIVIVNKIDLIPENQRKLKMDKIEQKLRKLFSSTFFGSSIPIIYVSATGDKTTEISKPIGINNILNALKIHLKPPKRTNKGPLHFAFDHAFAVTGHGTILTGTLLSGELKTNQIVNITNLDINTKIKSMQSFKEKINYAKQGDRVALSINLQNSQKLERGFIVDIDNKIPTIYGCIAVVQKIRFHKSKISNSQKFHCTIGHNTVMCNVQFFALCEDQYQNSNSFQQNSLTTQQSIHTSQQLSTGLLLSHIQQNWPEIFNFQKKYHFLEGLPLLSGEKFDEFMQIQDEEIINSLVSEPKLCFAILRFEKGIQVFNGSLFICSHLEENASKVCRLAFFGRILHFLTLKGSKHTQNISNNIDFNLSNNNFSIEKNDKLDNISNKSSSTLIQKKKISNNLSRSNFNISTNIANNLSKANICYNLDDFDEISHLNVYKHKTKFGKIDRFVNNDNYSIIVKNLFKSDEHASRFIGTYIKIHFILDGTETDLNSKLSKQNHDKNLENHKTSNAVSNDKNKKTQNFQKDGLENNFTNMLSKTVKNTELMHQNDNLANVDIYGRLERVFGKSGKCIVTFQEDITQNNYFTSISPSNTLVTLYYARNAFTKKSKILQIPPSK